MRCSGGLTRRFRTASGVAPHHNGTEALSGSGRTLARSILPLTSRVAFCVSPICPTSRSTASADTRQRYGAKSVRFYSHSMPWIAASRRREGGVTVSAAGKNWRPTRARSVDLQCAD